MEPRHVELQEPLLSTKVPFVRLNLAAWTLADHKAQTKDSHISQNRKSGKQPNIFFIFSSTSKGFGLFGRWEWGDKPSCRYRRARLKRSGGCLLLRISASHVYEWQFGLQSPLPTSAHHYFLLDNVFQMTSTNLQKKSKFSSVKTSCHVTQFCHSKFFSTCTQQRQSLRYNCITLLYNLFLVVYYDVVRDDE